MVEDPGHACTMYKPVRACVWANGKKVWKMPIKYGDWAYPGSSQKLSKAKNEKVL